MIWLLTHFAENSWGSIGTFQNVVVILTGTTVCVPCFLLVEPVKLEQPWTKRDTALKHACKLILSWGPFWRVPLEWATNLNARTSYESVLALWLLWPYTGIMWHQSALK